MPIELRLWWSAMIAIAVFNIVAWCCLATTHQRNRAWMPAADWRAKQLMLLLAAGYVAGCAYRSVFPVFDIPRLALADSMFASAFVGRMVATVAELCFAAQWVLLMRELVRAGGGRMAEWSAILILPLIGVAECASWHSVLTGVNLGHVIEESLWGICAGLILMAFWSVRHRLRHDQRVPHAIAMALCGGYVLYMFGVDVPQYFSRWMADLNAGREFAGLLEGAMDAATRRTVSHDWTLWRTEAVWMSAYFSLGVWVSLGLAALHPLSGDAAMRLRVTAPFGFAAWPHLRRAA